LIKNRAKTAKGTYKSVNKNVDKDPEIENTLNYIYGNGIQPNNNKRKCPFSIAFYIDEPEKETQ